VGGEIFCPLCHDAGMTREGPSRFIAMLASAVQRKGWEISFRHPEPFAPVRYEDEARLKEESLAAWWAETGLPGRLAPLVRAPVPRRYRTTSKRRAVRLGAGVALSFPGDRPARGRHSSSALDLPEHDLVYRFLAGYLNAPSQRHLSSALNHVIVRGGAGRLALILNLKLFNARIVRLARGLAEEVKRGPLGIGAMFLFLDPSESEYYLEARRPRGVSFKRMFGPPHLEVEVEGLRLRFPVTVFSQVNTPMLPVMVRNVRAACGPLEGRRLLDLFCGYGLFAFTVGARAQEVIGVDASGSAILAARANASHLGGKERRRFLAGRIDGEFLTRRLDRAAATETALLDPPRQGTEDNVAAALASRGIRRVVHICCGIDTLPREVWRWSDAGYRLEKATPLDLFAGTAGLEIVLQFRAGPGLQNRP